MAQLFSDAAPPKPVVAAVHKAATAPRAPNSRVYLVEVFNGSKKTESKFPAAEEKQ
jgi:hypothetical protein